MAIDARLLEILRCPACRSEVSPVAGGGGLACGSCHRVYPVVDDIPVMLVEEAKVPG